MDRRGGGLAGGWTDGRIEWWAHGQADGRTDGRADGPVGWRTDSRTNGLADGRTDRRADGQVDGRTGLHTAGRADCLAGGQDTEHMRRLLTSTGCREEVAEVCADAYSVMMPPGRAARTDSDQVRTVRLASNTRMTDKLK
jgi:hypothetical protein